MKELIKTVSYKGHIFNIILILNVRVERRINGDIWHLLKIEQNDTSKIIKQLEIKDIELELTMITINHYIKAFVDEHNFFNGEIKDRFTKLGFSEKK